MRVAVVGHVEYVEFVDVERVPAAGEIAHGTSRFAVAAGGGGVAAVALARFAGNCTLYTALGDDELGRRAVEELRTRGVDVRVAWRREPQRRAITMVDTRGERTITVIGARHVPHGDDALNWRELRECDGVYITGGDSAALREARRARAVVATARIVTSLQEAAIPLDALVSSAADPAEQYAAGELQPEPAIVVRTEGERGGSYVIAPGARVAGGGAAGVATRYEAVPAVITGDTYGAGDTFAAALTFALAGGAGPADAMAAAAARAAEVVAWRGPYPA